MDGEINRIVHYLNIEANACRECHTKSNGHVLHIFTFSKEWWKKPPHGYLNCLDPLAKILEIQES